MADSIHSGSDSGWVLPGRRRRQRPGRDLCRSEPPVAPERRSRPNAGPAGAAGLPSLADPPGRVGCGTAASQVGSAAYSGRPSVANPSRVVGRVVTPPLAVVAGAGGSAVSSDGTRRCSSRGACSRAPSSSAHQSRPPGAARVRVEERSFDSRNRNASMRRARASSSHSIQFSRYSSRRRHRSQVRYVSNRLSHSRANSRVTVQPGSSPSRLRRMNVWTAVMASSIRLALSRRPASTSSSSRSLRSPGAVANVPGCQGSGTRFLWHR